MHRRGSRLLIQGNKKTTLTKNKRDLGTQIGFSQPRGSSSQTSHEKLHEARGSFPQHHADMDRLPEILHSVASYLDADDLRNFRLVSPECARAGASFIARNGLSVLNTSAGLREIRELLQYKSIAFNTRQLTICHGEWAVCSRREWGVHPLLLAGQSRFQGLQTRRASVAFAAYSAFMAEEKRRRPKCDVEAISEALSLLPNLRAVAISHVKSWVLHPSRNIKYRELQERVWLAPNIKPNVVSPAAHLFLRALRGGFSNVTCLVIHGTFNPAELSRAVLQLPSIHTLHINSLQVQGGGVTRKFLEAFPNLVDLSVTFQGWGQAIPDIVGELFWPHLRRLRLDELWASEEEIFSVFEHHQEGLDCFSLGNTTITQGSWRSLFSRMRNLKAQGQVIADGELFGRRSKDTLNMNSVASAQLDQFMQDGQRLWPFGE